MDLEKNKGNIRWTFSFSNLSNQEASGHFWDHWDHCYQQPLDSPSLELYDWYLEKQNLFSYSY